MQFHIQSYDRPTTMASMVLHWEGKDPNEDIVFEGFGGGYDFIETMGMHMKEGRSFSRSYGDEIHQNLILNEAAVKVMHLKNPVGKILRFLVTKEQIIGVVKDFHFESLHEADKTICFSLHDPRQKNPWYKI